jgi:ATPase subunit of ABC transporter with duplicated ATPase domains
MSLVIKNLKKSYDNHLIFDGVSMSLNQGEHIALIGDNGVGKTTLLNLLAGVEEPTGGMIIRDDYSQTIIVSQDFPSEFLGSGWKVHDYIQYHGGDKLERGTLRILKDFNLDEKFLELELSHLSGGQKKILDIAVSFAKKPQYLLLDEPENHIDIFGRQVVIDMINNFRGCLVFVSHDQDLINAVTNRIIEVIEEKLVSYTGTYDFYLEEKERQAVAREREWKQHGKEVKRLDALVKRMREWVKKNPDLGAQLRAKKTQLARLKDNAPKKPLAESKMRLSMHGVDQKRNKSIVSIEEFSLALGGKRLFDQTSAYMTFGQKVAIIGRNGTGKSVLLKTIMGEFTPDGGSVRIGVDIAVGYFSQDNREALDEQKTPIQILSDVVDGPEHKLRSTLARFLIGENAYNRPVRTLSGGQKTRLRFCLLFNRPNELLLLDEPTNHLDNTSWDVLVQAVTEFNGSILMVSHDRVFIDQTATKLWTVENMQIKEYLGTLTEYLLE